ncbi:MAG: glycosyltransferase [Candidatus Bathyarchaeia archaeon]
MIALYLGVFFPPLSLFGLFVRGSTIASASPKTMVSVIVPVYNGEKTIADCIRHLELQSLRPTEIIVVDDGSRDKTPIMLEELSRIYSNITVVKNPRNMGKCASINSVLDQVRFPYVAVVDSDTNLGVDYLRNVLGAFQREDVVGVSGMVLPIGSETAISKARLIEYLHGQSTYKNFQNRVGTIFVAPGCCTVWRSSWIKKRGIPTETIVEDMDLTWESQIDGGKIFYVQDAVAYTAEPDSFRKYVHQIDRWFSWRPVVEKHARNLTNGLKFLVTWIFLESIGYAFWLGLTLHFLITGNYFSIFILLSVDLFLVSLISFYQGRKIRLPLRSVLSSIPFYYLLKLPTILIFWKSLISPKKVGW